MTEYKKGDKLWVEVTVIENTNEDGFTSILLDDGRMPIDVRDNEVIKHIPREFNIGDKIQTNVSAVANKVIYEVIGVYKNSLWIKTLKGFEYLYIVPNTCYERID